MKRLLFFLFFICAFVMIKAQQENSVELKIQRADSVFETNRDSAITVLNKLLAKFTSNSSERELALLHKSLGRMYYFKSDFPSALSHYQACDQLIEKNHFSGIELQLRNLYGTFYKKQKQYDKALSEFQKGITLATSEKDSSALAGLLGDAGLVFAEQHDYAKARSYFERALDLHLKTKNELGASYAYDYLAEIFAVENNFDKALEYMKRALEIREKSNNETLIAINLNNIGEIYIQNKDYKSAASYLEKSIERSRRIKFNDLLQHSLGLLSECYKSLGDFKLALALNEEKIRLKDSIFNENNSRIIQEVEGKYQSQKKQNEIDKLNAQNQLSELEMSKQRSIIFSFTIILVIVVAALIAIFRYYGKLKKSHVIIHSQKEQTEHQKRIIEEKQNEILDSITYAKRIQSTLLAQDELLRQNIGTDYFILYKPKDIVSGDFYWSTNVTQPDSYTPSQLFYFAVCDSTGHGVPGAFMSLLNIGYLSEAINEKHISEPDEIFNYTRQRLIDSVNKDGQKDGFDGILLKIEKSGDEKIITYCAAHNPPVIVSRGQCTTLACDKMPVGIGEKKNSFTKHTLHFREGDMLYLFTDGYADQFGGPKGKKFKYKQLTELLETISHEPATKQSEILAQRFNDWKGELEQIDDVCVVGMRL